MVATIQSRWSPSERPAWSAGQRRPLAGIARERETHARALPPWETGPVVVSAVLWLASRGSAKTALTALPPGNPGQVGLLERRPLAGIARERENRARRHSLPGNRGFRWGPHHPGRWRRGVSLPSGERCRPEAGAPTLTWVLPQAAKARSPTADPAPEHPPSDGARDRPTGRRRPIPQSRHRNSDGNQRCRASTQCRQASLPTPVGGRSLFPTSAARPLAA